MDIAKKKSDLEGFVVFTNTKGISADFTIGLRVTGGTVSLTQGAVKRLGNAKFVNVFFDYPGKRMMIRKSEQANANVFCLQNDRYLTGEALRRQIFDLAGIMPPEAGTGLRFEGYQPGAPDCVIFDLSKPAKYSTGKGKKK